MRIPAKKRIGQRFGLLIVLSVIEGGRARAVCRCDCGAESKPRISNLVTGETKSCGCLKAISTRIAKTTHGHHRKKTPSPTYISWVGMIGRCTNPNNPKFPRYGARGITVCERWRTSFESFLADMGPRPKGLFIDRINNDGNYEPSNCRWATALQQAQNKSNSPKYKATKIPPPFLP